MAGASAALGCGRVNFDERTDASPPVARTCDWTNGPPFTAPPQLRTDLGSAFTEVDPFLSIGDPLTMYFGSSRASGGSLDIYVARRPALDQPFTSIAPVTELNTPGASETGLVLDPTGTRGFYTAGNPSRIRAVGRTVTGTLQDLGVVPELALMTDSQDAWPSQDELRLTFTLVSATASELYTASRAAPTDPWTNVTRSPVNLPARNGGATLTADERVIVWSANPALDTADLYYATRADRTLPFGSPQLIAITVDPTQTEFEPSIREDGCELFFCRSDGLGEFKPHSVVAEPPP